MKHEKQLDTNSHCLLSKSHPFITQHAPAHSESNTVASHMHKTTIFLWASKTVCWEICSLVSGVGRGGVVIIKLGNKTRRHRHIRAEIYTRRFRRTLSDSHAHTCSRRSVTNKHMKNVYADAKSSSAHYPIPRRYYPFFVFR